MPLSSSVRRSRSESFWVSWCSIWASEAMSCALRSSSFWQLSLATRIRSLRQLFSSLRALTSDSTISLLATSTSRRLLCSAPLLTCSSRDFSRSCSAPTTRPRALSNCLLRVLSFSTSQARLRFLCSSPSEQFFSSRSSCWSRWSGGSCSCSQCCCRARMGEGWGCREQGRAGSGESSSCSEGSSSKGFSIQRFILVLQQIKEVTAKDQTLISQLLKLFKFDMAESAPKETAPKQAAYNKNEKSRDIRTTNIQAAKAVADCIRTSLGPRGMDKMIRDGRGETLITNDGATILQKLDVVHPTAKMLVEISKAQDVEAGDGTTSVVVLAGALLKAAESLLDRGIHPNIISEGFQRALDQSLEFIKSSLSIPVDISSRETLMECVNTSLSSKVVSANSELLSPMAVDAVLKIIDPLTATNVDLKDIRIVKKLGGTIDDTQLIEGIVFDKCKPSTAGGGPTRIENAKIAVVQFQIATPKTDLENSVIVKDYQAMDRIMREERKLIAEMVKKVVASGANVLLIQKSILKEATNDLSLHFLAKKGIMVVQDIERDEVDFICRSINAIPIAHIDHMTPDKFGTAALCEQTRLADDTKVFTITGLKSSRTVSVLVRGSNPLVIDEAERSLHDALCVIRSLIKSRGLITGGGSVQLEIATKLQESMASLQGLEGIIFRAYSEALEIIAYTLAENAGMNPITVVTELRNRHFKGERWAGISVRKGAIVNMKEEKVLQPALVTQSALTLATEVVRMILKIDDVVMTAR